MKNETIKALMLVSVFLIVLITAYNVTGAV